MSRQDKIEEAKQFFRDLLEGKNVLNILRAKNAVDKSEEDFEHEQKLRKVAEDGVKCGDYHGKLCLEDETWALMYKTESMGEWYWQFCVVRLDAGNGRHFVYKSFNIFKDRADMLISMALYAKVGAENQHLYWAVDTILRGMKLSHK